MYKLKVYLAGWTGEVEYRKYVHDKYEKDFDILDPMVVCFDDVIQDMKHDCACIFTVRKDKKLILDSDILVAYVTKCTWGTSMEIEWAYSNGIPVFLIDPSKEIRNDIWVKFHIYKAFDSPDDCFNYMLNKV